MWRTLTSPRVTERKQPDYQAVGNDEPKRKNKSRAFWAERLTVECGKVTDKCDRAQTSHPPKRSWA